MRPLLSALCVALLSCLSFAAIGETESPASRAISQAIEAGDLERADKLAQAQVKADKKDASGHYWLSRVQLAQGDAEASVKSMERAVKLAPDNALYHRDLGDTYAERIEEIGSFGQMRMAGKIRKAYARAVELDPKDTDARFGLMMFYINAPGIAGGSKEKGLEQAQAIGALEPARGAMAEAMVFQSDEQMDKAVDALRRSIALDPEPSDPHVALGIRLTGDERYAEAIEVFQSRLNNFPDDMMVLYQIGRTASISAEFLTEGKTAFGRYLNEYTPAPGDPGKEWAWYRLGLIHKHGGDLPAARTSFEQALAIDPKHDQAKEALGDL